MNYPLKFNSIYKKKIWGGSRLRTLLGRELLLDCPKFSLELLELEKYIGEEDNADSFQILSVIKGEGKLQYGEDKKDFVDFSAGESILIPAILNSYGLQLSSKCRVIKTSSMG